MNCPYCGKEAAWVPNEKIYGKRYGKSYMAYWCKDCDAYVGCHNNTREPLGTMANKELREYRMKAHAVVDPLWKSGRFGRGYVYSMLAKWFDRPVVHIGESDKYDCVIITMGFAEYMRTHAKPKELSCDSSL